MNYTEQDTFNWETDMRLETEKKLESNEKILWEGKIGNSPDCLTFILILMISPFIIPCALISIILKNIIFIIITFLIIVFIVFFFVKAMLKGSSWLYASITDLRVIIVGKKFFRSISYSTVDELSFNQNNRSIIVKVFHNTIHQQNLKRHKNSRHHYSPYENILFYKMENPEEFYRILNNAFDTYRQLNNSIVISGSNTYENNYNYNTYNNSYSGDIDNSTRDYIVSDENILWSGKMIRLPKGNTYASIFSLLFIAFALLLCVKSIFTAPSELIKNIPLLLFGFLFLFLFKRNPKSTYVLTDRRLIINSNKVENSVPLEQITDTVIKHEKNNTGYIVLRKIDNPASRRDHYRIIHIGVIEDVDYVYNIIIDAIAQAKASNK